jgi:DNA-binding transcriptional ArsR family regulator
MHISDAEFARLAADIPDAKPSRAPRWRRNARHWDEVSITSPLDRNERVRIIHKAETLERRTKAKGRASGAIGLTGLAILRVLLFRFLSKTGRCFPSYAAIQRETGFSLSTISAALKRLEAAGLVYIARRLERRNVSRQCHVTGRWQSFLTTVQTSNWYHFGTGVAGLEDFAPPPIHREFKAPSIPPLLRALHPTLIGGKKPPSPRY